MQTWLVSMETGEGGKPHLLALVVAPLQLCPLPEGGREGGRTCQHIIFSPSTLSYRDGLGPWEGDWGDREAWGCQDPRRFSAFSPPAFQLDWGRPRSPTPHPRHRLMSRPHALLSLVRLMTVHRVPSARLCGSWVRGGGKIYEGHRDGWGQENSAREMEGETKRRNGCTEFRTRERQIGTIKQKHQQRQRDGQRQK